ncbi:MAG: uracil-DNA glycosylase [Lachnospiraceae bacterium]|nr:uracil-DNA glycosylase [Lachnospiraceae bacterium]
MPGIENDWLEVYNDEFKKPYYRELYRFIKDEYGRYTVYPPSDEIFSAYKLTPMSKVKVVIIGQDPYHEPGQAHGLSFSVKPGIDIPPSLVNIYKELESDLGCRIPNNGYLVKWAEQGVLLLNSVLTVRAHAAFSHQGHGWEEYTDAAIKGLNKVNRPIVFILWGSSARKKKQMLDNPAHLIIESAHPSPLSAYRGFFGSRPFSRTNEFLVANGETPIDWQIEDI